jgi:hypothetical protein
MKLLPFIHTMPVQTIYKQNVDFRFDISIPTATANTRLDDAFTPSAQDIKIKRLYIDNKAMTAEQVEELLGLVDIYETIFDAIIDADLEPWNTYDSEDDNLF